jgi:choline dehydrogenase-like flavoprotein
MALFDAIIVGSGAAGVMAARALQGKRVLVLDVGRHPAAVPDNGVNWDVNLYDERRRSADLFEFLIGDKFESLNNLYREPVSLKLKSPLMKYIADGAESLSPVRSGRFGAVMSFAAGGLANAWGAGVYRFTSRDLDGFPVRQTELDPFYDELTRHIGVSGANDDLTPFFGEDGGLQPPVELSRFATELLAGYRRRRSRFAGMGVAIGRTRLAVLTRPHRGRQPYGYGNFEFFRPQDPAVYNPAYTLRELIDGDRISYEPEHLVVGYTETEQGLEVITRNLATGAAETFEGRTLILAAGALNSAKLVLHSNRDHETRLPLLDNPMSCLPLFRLSGIGRKLDNRDSSIGQLNVIQEYQGTVLQGSLYGAAGPLRSDVLFGLPLSIRANVSLLRRMAAASGLLMMFYPADPHPGNYLRLAMDGTLEIEYGEPAAGEPAAGGPARGLAEKELIRGFRKIGFHTTAALCQYPPAGSSIHYAGTLPMRESPGRYQLYPDGRLQGTRNVYVADGACFPRLPAKNLTFTIMANAMRIAARIRDAVL